MDSAVAASLDVTDRLQQLFTNVALGVASVQFVQIHWLRYLPLRST